MVYDVVLPDFPAQDHVAIGEGLGRWILRWGKIIRVTICCLRENVQTGTSYCRFYAGYTYAGIWLYGISAAYLVKSETMAGTGQLPKFALDLFNNR